MAEKNQNIVALCRLVGAALERHRAAQLAEAGYPDITHEGAPVLVLLTERDLSIGEISAGLTIPLREAVRRCDALEARGYLRRVGPLGDIRNRALRLTPSGRTAIETDRQLETDPEMRIVDQIGTTDIDAIRRVLTALFDQTRQTRTP